MRTEPELGAKAVPAQTGMDAHCKRVGVAAVQLSKRIGWSAARQRLVREAAEAHHQGVHPRDSHMIRRLTLQLWGYSGKAGAARDTANARNDIDDLIELCCCFVRRWEFMPYEMISFADIISELRGMSADGFFPRKSVEALAMVPAIGLPQVKKIVSRMPVFPAIAMRAMKMSQDRNATASHLEYLINSDASLAKEILSATNSQLHTTVLPVCTIRQAVVRLGMEECCRIVAATAFRSMFPSPTLRPFWNHSLEVARIVETLARSTGKHDPAEAFLAGLMHDVGLLAIWRPRYASLLKQGCEPMFAEVILCGLDHTQAGREILAHWRLPQRLREAVAFHHQPEKTNSALAHMLYLGEHASDSAEDAPSRARLERALQHCGLDHQLLQSLPCFHVNSAC
ncbi:MAG: HDOD domain-containing protein [Candidatus Solibacter usitatus]|nr:HDOD domain-containing protein [Candidatus Solibacter usitatus]